MVYSLLYEKKRIIIAVRMCGQSAAEVRTPNRPMQNVLGILHNSEIAYQLLYSLRHLWHSNGYDSCVCMIKIIAVCGCQVARCFFILVDNARAVAWSPLGSSLRIIYIF